MQIKGWRSQEISGEMPKEGDTLDSLLAAVHENGKLCEESPTLLSASDFHWGSERAREGFLCVGGHSHSPMPLLGVRHLVGQDWWHMEGRQGWGVGRWGRAASIQVRALVNAICWSISGTRGGTLRLCWQRPFNQPPTLFISLAHTDARAHTSPTWGQPSRIMNTGSKAGLNYQCRFPAL